MAFESTGICQNDAKETYSENSNLAKQVSSSLTSIDSAADFLNKKASPMPSKDYVKDYISAYLKKNSVYVAKTVDNIPTLRAILTGTIQNIKNAELGNTLQNISSPTSDALGSSLETQVIESLKDIVSKEVRNKDKIAIEAGIKNVISLTSSLIPGIGALGNQSNIINGVVGFIGSFRTSKNKALSKSVIDQFIKQNERRFKFYAELDKLVKDHKLKLLVHKQDLTTTLERLVVIEAEILKRFRLAEIKPYESSQFISSKLSTNFDGTAKYISYATSDEVILSIANADAIKNISVICENQIKDYEKTHNTFLDNLTALLESYKEVNGFNKKNIEDRIKEVSSIRIEGKKN